ncbi:MAG: PQQ-like beta-propeller repeat protein, partial [Ignavibacteriales bacterium]|nr:PQQ-like beta-propeller repeat protein [Ignavibacteriales bacterium]
MKKYYSKRKRIFYILMTILLGVATFFPIAISDFYLPPLGGGMVHCDPQMSENIWLPVPTTNVSIVWYRHDLGGELFGTWGNGIAGNGKIAACPFNNYCYFINDTWDNNQDYNNLIIYDYFGNRIWSDDELLNPGATSSNPMVDINNLVVACDNQTLMLVNASDQNNVEVNWTTTIPVDSFWSTHGLPFSPTIVEEKTIILPTKGGPLLAYNVTTGTKIAEKKLGLDGENGSYYGVPEMPMSDFLSIISNPTSCPFHYNNQNHSIEWISNISYGIMPLNYIFQEGNIIFINIPNGTIVAIDDTTDEILAFNSVTNPQMLEGPDYYSTINSALVVGNRVFLVCEKKGNVGRLYAVDVYPNDENEEDRLRVAWYYNYSGKSQKSQASPTLIGDIIYFDGYNDTINPQNRDPHIYAVYATNGTEKWNISYQNITWFTFTKNPRGGFWYEDCDQVRLLNNTGGNKLVRFNEENGSIIEEIDMKTILNDTGKNKDLPVLPSSDMTICGTPSYPIMLISANHQWRKEGKWVMAINLSDNNSVLWKIALNETFLSHMNYANGDYTILTENNQSRILFCTWLGG